jgi:hypothetical protein
MTHESPASAGLSHFRAWRAANIGVGDLGSRQLDAQAAAFGFARRAGRDADGRRGFRYGAPSSR